MILLCVVIPLTILVCGSLVYCGLAVLASARYRGRRPQPSREMPFVSILKPLAGAEEGLRENLVSFFEQDYPEFEVLLGVAEADDAAVSVAREIMNLYPQTHSALVISGEAPTPNRKVQSLRAMTAEARYDVLVMADSDIRVNPDLLRVIAAEMADLSVQVVTCPYRASAGLSIWTALEAIGLNTEFLARVLVAQTLSPMDFALGPTLAIRRDALTAIGGFDELQNYLAEDFVIGNRVARLGGRVVLSRFVVEHRLGTHSFAASFAHRLRWARSTRRSRPWGYLGEIFTHPIPLALLLLTVAPFLWPLAALSLLARFWAAHATSQRVLHDPLTRDLWYLIPLQDVLSFMVWIGAFWARAFGGGGGRSTSGRAGDSAVRLCWWFLRWFARWLPRMP